MVSLYRICTQTYQFLQHKAGQIPKLPVALHDAPFSYFISLEMGTVVTLTTFGGTSFCIGFPTYEDCKNLQIRLSHPIDAEIIFLYLIKPQFLQRLKTVF